MARRVDTRAKVWITLAATGEEFDLTKSLINVSTTKDAGGGVGAYEVEFYPSFDACTRFRAGDWCEVYFETVDGEELAIWGPLTQVQRRRSATGSGSVQQRMYLHGQDFMRVLSNTEILFDSPLSGPEFAKYLTGLADKDAISSIKAGPFVRALITSILGDSTPLVRSTQITLPGTDNRGLLDYLGVNLPEILGNRPDDFSALTTAVSGQTTTLMSMCEQWADLPNNYFYGDIRPGTALGRGTSKLWKPAIILDRHPYSRTDFDKLKSVRVTAEDVTLEDVGYHDQDVRNWFIATPDPVNESTMSGIRYLPDSIDTYGVRRWDQRTAYAWSTSNGSIDSTKMESLGTILDIFTLRAMEWYGTNDQLLNGTINMRLMPSIRPMMRLEYLDTYTGQELHFLVESVSHQWSFAPTTSSTQVTVSRGFDIKNPPVLGPYNLISRKKGL